MIGSIDAVGFDIDGTLYPASMMYICSISSFFRDPLLMYHFGKMRRDVRSVVTEISDTNVEDPRSQFRELQANMILKSMGKPVSQQRTEKMLERIERHVYSIWTKSFSRVRPFKGVHQSFDRLHIMGLKIGLLSDFPPGVKPASLGVESRIDMLYSAEDAGQLKPHPAPFEAFARKLGISDLSRIIYVGNSYEKDIAGAKRVGMKTALFIQHPGVARKEHLRERYPDADIIFSSYEQFPELIRMRFFGGNPV